MKCALCVQHWLQLMQQVEVDELESQFLNWLVQIFPSTLIQGLLEWYYVNWSTYEAPSQDLVPILIDKKIVNEVRHKEIHLINLLLVDGAILTTGAGGSELVDVKGCFATKLLPFVAVEFAPPAELVGTDITVVVETVVAFETIVVWFCPIVFVPC